LAVLCLRMVLAVTRMRQQGYEMINSANQWHSKVPPKLNIYWHMGEKSDEQGSYFEAQLEASDIRLAARSLDELKQKIELFEQNYWESFRVLKEILGMH